MEPYFYNAECTKVIDGDTIDVTIDVGFGFKTKQRLRLLGINTPERNKVGYKEATQYTTDKMLGKNILINTIEKDVFGRWLSKVYYIEDDSYKFLNEELLLSGLAVVYQK